MATLLRIGSLTINLDQVTHIEDQPPALAVWFGERCLSLSGDQADT